MSSLTRYRPFRSLTSLRGEIDHLSSDFWPEFEDFLEEESAMWMPSMDLAEGETEYVIVMASHGLTGFEHFLMSSVAERVVWMAPCPVFIVKPFGKSLLWHQGNRSLKALEHEGA